MSAFGGAEGAGFDLAGSGAEALDGDDPQAIGPIPLLGRLGSGGMGRVYLGAVDGRYAAVKQVLPQFIEDKDFQRHFGHELDNLARLPEEVTAPLLAADREARPPWFATAYIPGLTLNQVLAVNGGPLDAPRLWTLLREAAAGLRAVHALDMVHRDLKPSNLMLTTRGVTLIDFGVARAADQSRLTRTGMVLGTPAYMAPEQANGAGECTAAVDVFALGALVAYAASGRPPFGEGSGVDMLYRIVHTEPDLSALRELDADLAETVAACLDKNAAARPTADRLVQLASQRRLSELVDWPEPVMNPLRERAAFAAQPTPPPPPEPKTLVLAVPPAGSGRPGRHRRRWVAPLVVPVILAVGATTAVELLPHLAPSHAAQGAPPANVVVGTPSGSPATHGSASASASASATASSAPASATAKPGTSAGGQAAGSGSGNGGSGGNGGGGGVTGGSGSGGSGGGSGGGKPSTPPAKPAPKPTHSPSRPLGPRCVFANTTSCTSNNPTVEMTMSGGWTSCTFTFTTNWGDGTTTYADSSGTGSTSVRKVYATHHYSSPGTYTINVRAVTDSGFCLATGGTETFVLTR